MSAFVFPVMAFRSTKAGRTLLLAFGVVYALTGLAGVAVTDSRGGMGRLLSVGCILVADTFRHTSPRTLGRLPIRPHAGSCR